MKTRVARATSTADHRYRPRYEFKYLIHPAQVAQVRDVASAFLEPDPMGDVGIYWVYSLYLDTWDWLTAQEALEGLQRRFKLRIRTYDPWGTGSAFAEIKRRNGMSLMKSRAVIPHELARDLALGLPLPAELEAVPALADFRNHMDTLDMTPRMWVRYRREAWVSPWGDRTRLTFDSHLEVQLADEEEPMLPSRRDWHVVPLEAPIILEMKFDDASPAWMQRVTYVSGLKRVSCSKYTQGAVLVGDLPWARRERSETWTT